MKLALAFPIGPLSLGRYLKLQDRNDWSIAVIGPETYRDQTESSGAAFVQAEQETADIALLGQLVRANDCQGVVPGGEFSVAIADEIAAAAGLPHNPLQCLPTYRNKFSMRSRFAEYGVPQPGIIGRFSSIEEVAAYDWKDVSFPVIVKPVDMAASMYVKVCHGPDEVTSVIAAILDFVAQGVDGQQFKGEALVEADGPEFSAECLVEEGSLKRHFLTTKYVSPSPHRNEVAHLSGDVLPESARAEVDDAIQKVIASWGVRNTVMHVEFKVARNGIRVIEAGNRVAGDRITELVEARYGVSLEETFCLLRCGCRVAIPSPIETRPQPFYGVRFLFSEGEASVPAEIDVAKQDRWARKAPAEPMTFDIKQRVGFQIVSSDSRSAMDAFLRQSAARANT